MGRRNNLKIAVIGDEGVGKTTLLHLLSTNNPSESVPKRYPNVIISTEDFPDDVNCPTTTTLVDCSKNMMTASLLKEIDSILLIYNDLQSYNRVYEHWLPELRKMGMDRPLIVLKNEFLEVAADGNGHGHRESCEMELMMLTTEFKEISSTLHGSLIKGQRVNLNLAYAAVYHCIRSVVYALPPLYDYKTNELKKSCQIAMKRIFTLADDDMDGVLNYYEMKKLQEKCFPVSKNMSSFDELEFERLCIEIKMYKQEESTRMEREHTLDLAANTNKSGIDLYDFYTLIKIYIERGKFETVWGLLRGFKYNDILQISDDLLYPSLDSFIDDGQLHRANCTTDRYGNVNLSGWLAQWAMTTFLDYKTTTKYLVYFGYQDNPRDCLKITKPKKYKKRNGLLYRANVSDRKVFNCFVIGKAKCGKSTLLRSFANKDDSDTSSLHAYYSPTIRPNIVTNSLELDDGKQYYLILQEFGQTEEEVLSNERKWEQCDVVVCLAYDSSDPESFSYILSVIQRFKHLLKIPCIVVALKADLDTQDQRCPTQPKDFCDALNLDSPLRISAYWPSMTQLFEKIVNVSLQPLKATPGFDSDLRKYSINDEFRNNLGSTIGALSVLSVLSIGVYKLLAKKNLN
ncbi:unnamed protein product [Hanseniaspora opuntiae]